MCQAQATHSICKRAHPSPRLQLTSSLEEEGGGSEAPTALSQHRASTGAQAALLRSVLPPSCLVAPVGLVSFMFVVKEVEGTRVLKTNKKKSPKVRSLTEPARSAAAEHGCRHDPGSSGKGLLTVTGFYFSCVGGGLGTVSSAMCLCAR